MLDKTFSDIVLREQTRCEMLGLLKIGELDCGNLLLLLMKIHNWKILRGSVHRNAFLGLWLWCRPTQCEGMCHAFRRYMGLCRGQLMCLLNKVAIGQVWVVNYNQRDQCGVVIILNHQEGLTTIGRQGIGRVVWAKFETTIVIIKIGSVNAPPP